MNRVLEVVDTERIRYLFRKGTLPKEFTVAKLATQIIANCKNIKADKQTEAHEEAIKSSAH